MPLMRLLFLVGVVILFAGLTVAGAYYLATLTGSAWGWRALIPAALIAAAIVRLATRR